MLAPAGGLAADGAVSALTAECDVVVAAGPVRAGIAGVAAVQPRSDWRMCQEPQ